MTLYDVNKYIIKPETKQKQCSYVELVAPKDTRAQTPKWFVSHWWGEPVKEFIACLAEHARVRRLGDEEAVYWFCACSINLHALGADITADPRESAFFKAMQMCDGVLVVVDRSGALFTRIWYCFEQATMVQGKKLLLDFATVQSGASQLLTEGFAYEGEAAQMKAARERGFPLELLEQGYTMDITKAEASRPDDKRHILNSIAGRPLDWTGLDSRLHWTGYRINRHRDFP